MNEQLPLYLGDLVDEVLVLVAVSEKARLLQAPEVSQDLPLLLLQGQLAVLQERRVALQTLWSLSVLDCSALYDLSVLRHLQEQSILEDRTLKTAAVNLTPNGC